MKVFSSAMFPTAKKSYESMLSQGIKGTGGHYINIAHIRNVLDFIESRYRMAIKDVISPDDFLSSINELEYALLTNGLIDHTQLRDRPPLSEVFAKIHNSAQLLNLLRRYRRDHKTVHGHFDASFKRLTESDRCRSLNFFMVC